MDMGRTKEALLVMEFCEKSLVNVLESRGAGYFQENQVLSIFRDVCNAVFAMHCQSPPIAHRDLKAENLLLGSDGLWKLCDFGSTSTNHKRFVKPEEMGIEEDVIRKHTTPAYRAPEMWDLFRRDLINEKVDIWALGCLLYRICYFKSAFDGESKLQVLNGNYRIPDAPKYNSAVIDLIRDMLQISPDNRPDITQFELYYSHANFVLQTGISKLTAQAAVARRSSPTPPASTDTSRKLSPPIASVGSFWSSSHAEESIVGEDNCGLKFDQVTSPLRDLNQRNPPVESLSKPRDGHSKDSTGRSSQGDELKPDRTVNFQDEAFNTFVAEFDTSKLNYSASSNSSGKQSLDAEVERLKEQLKQVNLEKSEITSKYERLSAICRSQRLEIQELKQASVTSQSDGTVQQGFLDRVSTKPEPKPWQAFSDDSALNNNAQPRKQNAASSSGEKNSSKSSWDLNNGDNKQASQPAGWAGF